MKNDFGKNPKAGRITALPHDTPRFLPCNLSNGVICCSRCCQQRPGRRFPSIFFGGDASFVPDRKREGVTVMVTWDGIFQFCMLIAAVIALVLQANNKKR